MDRNYSLYKATEKDIGIMKMLVALVLERIAALDPALPGLLAIQHRWQCVMPHFTAAEYPEEYKQRLQTNFRQVRGDSEDDVRQCMLKPLHIYTDTQGRAHCSLDQSKIFIASRV